MPEKNVQVNTDRGLPYERFLQFGPENLTEAELLAVILRTGTKEDSAVALAEKVLALATYPREGLLGLHDVSVEELMEIPEMNRQAAESVVQFFAAKEREV